MRQDEARRDEVRGRMRQAGEARQDEMRQDKVRGRMRRAGEARRDEPVRQGEARQGKNQDETR